MINLTEHIEHLIVRNDCVIVPGFGAFIAEKLPAYIDKEQGAFMPPSRRLSFNPRIDHNDGLLVSSLMRRHCWSFTLASESLADCVAALKKRLASAGSLNIGSLGTLRYQDEATPEFVPAVASIAVNPYAVLPGLQVTPIKQLISASSNQTNRLSDAIASYDESLRQHPIWLTAARSIYSRVAVAVAVIATCIFTLLSPRTLFRPDDPCRFRREFFNVRADAIRSRAVHSLSGSRKCYSHRQAICPTAT